MSDTPIVKGFLDGIHSALRWFLHAVLIPIVWLLEVIQGWLNHLIVMLQKI